jgi:hypothetical protein
LNGGYLPTISLRECHRDQRTATCFGRQSNGYIVMTVAVEICATYQDASVAALRSVEQDVLGKTVTN